MQMSRTETEFLRSRKYDVYTRGALIAPWQVFRGWITRYALPSGERIINAYICEGLGDSIKSPLSNVIAAPGTPARTYAGGE